ncbi:MAG: GYF domain-containing protein [Pirellulaceae bacterium]|nr:GYF domain-containing protein [Pirellulaceae bacterium]MDP7016715.1 GYF domain-containing protein [Pirellulaceae bacterium]
MTRVLEAKSFSGISTGTNQDYRSPAMSDWYYQITTGEVGPLSSSELLDAIRGGAVIPATPIRKGDSQWVDAESVNGLFEAVHKLRIYYCPYCQARCEKPPTTCRSCHRWFEISEKFRDPREPKNNGKAKTGFRGWVKNLMVNDDD